MSLTPAQDNLDAQRKRDAVEKCGKNGGPHDYMPIEWMWFDEKTERVTRMLCRICFVNIKMSELIGNYTEVKF